MNESDVWIGMGVTQFLSYPQVTRYFHNPRSKITDHMHATATPKLENLQFRGTHHSNQNIYTYNIFSNDLEIYRFKSKYTVHYLLISKFNVWHFHLMHTNIIECNNKNLKCFPVWKLEFIKIKYSQSNPHSRKLQFPFFFITYRTLKFKKKICFMWLYLQICKRIHRWSKNLSVIQISNPRLMTGLVLLAMISSAWQIVIPNVSYKICMTQNLWVSR